MDKKLQIFVKDKGYRIGIEYIILYGLLFCILLSNFINSFNEVKNKQLESISILLATITFLYTIIFLISNLFRYERLYGHLKGTLVFEKDKIVFGEITYNLTEINKIEISNFDCKGKIVNASLEFKPKKSNGVKNYVKLYLKNGTSAQCNFLQTESEKIQIFKDEFKTYYRFNLIERQNYLNITEDK
jgi:hypothetical protein